MARRRAWRGGGPSAGAAALAAFLVLASQIVAQASSSVTLADVTVTLQSAQYYAGGDYTRFTYEVEGATSPSCAYWVLGTCAAPGEALLSTSPASQLVDVPFAGLRFVPSVRNEKFYLYVAGQWPLGTVPLAVAPGLQGSPQVLTGWIDGPSCDVASLSLAISAGSSVAFPTVSGPGIFPALNGTALRVQSTSPGWVLTASESFLLPGGGSQAVVERIFEVAVGPYASASGTTDVPVGYLLRVAEADFGSLPEGIYQITITYTVVLN